MMRLAHRIYVAGLSPPAEDHVRLVLAMEARSVRTVKCPLCHDCVDGLRSEIFTFI